MKKIDKIAIKLSLTKAEITLITSLLGFLLLGGAIKTFNTGENAKLLISQAEQARYSESEVDSLLQLATIEMGEAEKAIAIQQQPAPAKPANTATQAQELQASAKKNFSGTIAFNNATREELLQLPGVGAVMADRMIRFRTDKGGKIESLESLVEVKGIGTKKLERLKPYLTLE